jgi:hypothetical protein
MSLTEALERYFSAWNDHDPDAVVSSFAGGGTYEDPTTAGPLRGKAPVDNVAGDTPQVRNSPKNHRSTVDKVEPRPFASTGRRSAGSCVPLRYTTHPRTAGRSTTTA